MHNNNFFGPMKNETSVLAKFIKLKIRKCRLPCDPLIYIYIYIYIDAMVLREAQNLLCFAFVSGI
jgi:hypothetical protein